jgi:hypothetical protein
LNGSSAHGRVIGEEAVDAPAVISPTLSPRTVPSVVGAFFRPAGKKAFSGRSVQMCTPRPSARARATSVVASPGAPSFTGTTSVLNGPMALA